MPGVVDANASFEQQQNELSARLQEQGIDAPTAARLADEQYAFPRLLQHEAEAISAARRDADDAQGWIDGFEPGRSDDPLQIVDAGSGATTRRDLLESRLRDMVGVRTQADVDRHLAFVEAQVGRYDARLAQARADGDFQLAAAVSDERALFNQTLGQLQQRRIELDYRTNASQFADSLSQRGDHGFSQDQLRAAMDRMLAGESISGNAADEFLRRSLASDNPRLFADVISNGDIVGMMMLGASGSVIATPRGAAAIAEARAARYGSTRPTGTLGGRPSGEPQAALPNADSRQRRGVRLQNEAADRLAEAGYRVERLQRSDNDSSPDLRIEGRLFEVKSPEAGTSAWNAIDRMARSDQADRFVLNLSESDLSRHEVRAAFHQYVNHGIREVIVIARDGTMYRLP